MARLRGFRRDTTLCPLPRVAQGDFRVMLGGKVQPLAVKASFESPDELVEYVVVFLFLVHRADDQTHHVPRR